MLRIRVKEKTVAVDYDLGWLTQLMVASSSSMVAFSMFTERAKPLDERLYPRASNPGFTLGSLEPSTAASAGGRKPTKAGLDELCELLGDEDWPLPLADVAILSKRAVCLQARKGAPKLKYLELLGGGLDEKDARLPPWPIHGYPMLCVMGRGTPAKGSFLDHQGGWRTLQCVFGAVLTDIVRQAKIGVEVVSREGFGSVFPTLADLPGGIRLDPGLLPPAEGGKAIAITVELLDAFIGAFVLPLKQVPDWVLKMDGMQAAALAAVDRLMSALHELTAKSGGKATAQHYAEFLLHYNGSASKGNLGAVADSRVGYELELPASVPPPSPKKRVSRRVDSGYGSDSDYEDEDQDRNDKKEDEDEDEDQNKNKNKNKLGAKAKAAAPKAQDDSLTINKFAVVSGMAALRMATLFGMAYSAWLFKKGGLVGVDNEDVLNDVTTWAPYFELDHATLSQAIVGKNKAGVRALLFDGAPNPINVPEAPSKSALKDLGAVVIDTTNNTSMEKAQYIAYFAKAMAVPTNPKGAGGLILLVDSASKHPTGGDLVHGVLRVCGTRVAVDVFARSCLEPQIRGTKYIQTVLSDEETRGRRLLNSRRLVMRNGDLWRWLRKK